MGLASVRSQNAKSNHGENRSTQAKYKNGRPLFKKSIDHAVSGVIWWEGHVNDIANLVARVPHASDLEGFPADRVADPRVHRGHGIVHGAGFGHANFVRRYMNPVGDNLLACRRNTHESDDPALRSARAKQMTPFPGSDVAGQSRRHHKEKQARQ
jgi:hypothetical protein